MGRSRPKETVVPPPNTAAGHPDEVVTGVAYTYNCANLVSLLCRRVLVTGRRAHQVRCERFSVNVVLFCGVAKTGGGSTVIALGPSLPLLLEDLGVGRNTGTKRVAVEHLGWRTTIVVWGVPELKEASVECFTVKVS